MIHVLFICTQNVFRSMSAEKLMQKFLLDKQINDVHASSAGTVAFEWESPYSYTLQRLQELGVNDLDHKQRRVNEWMVKDADVIVCMTKDHQAFIKQNFDKDSYLFNELAYNKTISLCDDTETDYDDIRTFVRSTVDTIHQGIPHLTQSILNNQA